MAGGAYAPSPCPFNRVTLPSRNVMPNTTATAMAMPTESVMAAQSVVNETAVAMVASGMTALDEGNEPVVILSGNHHATGDLDFGI